MATTKNRLRASVFLLTCLLLVDHSDQLLLNQAHIRDRGKGPQAASARDASIRLVNARAAVRKITDKDEVPRTIGALDAVDLSNSTLTIG